MYSLQFSTAPASFCPTPEKHNRTTAILLVQDLNSACEVRGSHQLPRSLEEVI